MIILAVDLGKARTGLAVCDPGEVLASPYGVVTEADPERLAHQIEEAALHAHAELLVVGLPKNMDGTEGESARAAREMAALLLERTGLPVELVDERRTTVTAHEYLNAVNVRGKKRKAVVDAVAATVILEAFLERRRMAGKSL